ncbi:MAG: AP endonuclease [Spirochaetaceae bacterium]|jgi:hypothetical protein|nr:AP endonuclease [Spirochaetaceae bacterium]
MITVPSWVIPGSYLENLSFLKDKPAVQGVELLFFIYDQEVKALLDAESAELEAYTQRFTFTAHLPDALQEAHEELVTRLFPLVRHYVLHPGLEEHRERQAKIMLSWFERFGPQRFLLENTAPGLLEGILPRLPPETPLCMDTGHLLLEGKRPAVFFKHYRERIQEIHLHGIDRAASAADKRLPDHRSLASKAPWFQELVPELAEFTGVINLEVFSWEEVQSSLTVLGTLPT